MRFIVRQFRRGRRALGVSVPVPVLVLSAILLRAAPAAGGSVTLRPGDIVNTGNDAVYRVDPVTGASTVLSSGGLLVQPALVAVGTDATVYVSQITRQPVDFSGAIYAVNPADGSQRAVGTNLAFINAMRFDRAHGFVVAFAGDGPGPGSALRLTRVDPATGALTQLTPILSNVWDFDFGPGGDAYYLDPGAGDTTDEHGGTLFRIGLGGGATPAVVSAGGNFITPSGITFAPDGNFYVADYGVEGDNNDGSVIRVNPATGGQEVIANVQGAFKIAAEADGHILVSDVNPGLLRIDPRTGAQERLPNGGGLFAVVPADIAPPNPVPLPPAVLAAGPLTAAAMAHHALRAARRRRGAR